LGFIDHGKQVIGIVDSSPHVDATLLERQLGDWACGLFVMMALRCFALNGDYEKHCKDTLKEEMRQCALKALIALP